MSETLTVRPSQRGRRKLRNLWLNTRFQGGYIFWITITGLLLVALQSVVFYTFTRENYQILVDLSPMTPEAKAQLYSELGRIITILVAGSLIFVLLVAFMGLIFSHRTAGPLYHMRRVFEQIKAGDRSARIHLRPSDHFKDVAESFNEMMDGLEKR